MTTFLRYLNNLLRILTKHKTQCYLTESLCKSNIKSTTCGKIKNRAKPANIFKEENDKMIMTCCCT